VDFGEVLESYGVRLKLRGDSQHQGFCPLPSHEGQGRSPSFSANLTKRAFHCFGCGAQGNALDFVTMMEGWNPDDPRDIRRAALLMQERFLHETTAPPPAEKSRAPNGDEPRRFSPQRKNHRSRRNYRRERVQPPREDNPEETVEAPSNRHQPDDRKRIINAPLDFELKHLDPDHPYLQSRNLTPETIWEFGLGICSRGIMANRVAIPLHNTEGQLIGYAGRIVDDAQVDEKNPKYRLPGTRERDGTIFEFSKSAFLFNGHRIQVPATDLIVVEGFFSVFHMHQCGWKNVVALMGNSCSPDQAELILRLTSKGGRVWIMSDGDEGGIKCAESLLMQISPHRLVRWITLNDGSDPCDYSQEHLTRLLADEIAPTPTLTQIDCGDSDLQHIPMVSLRLVREKALPYGEKSLEDPQAVYDLFRELAGDLDREALWVICLNTKHHASCLSQVSLGTLNGAPARPADIFKVALLTNAWAVILLHNHPSGDPTPSLDDRRVTATIRDAAQIIGIKLLDHIIVGNGAFYSFREQGVL